MPPAKSLSTIRSDRVFLSNYAFSKLLGVHRVTVLRAMSKGYVEPAGWIDSNGNLSPIWTPAQAITLSHLIHRTPNPLPAVKS
jgi:hypothetical protein